MSKSPAPQSGSVTPPANRHALTPVEKQKQQLEKLLKDPTRLRQISERIPAGRWGDPKDFAGPVVFLASPASQYVCGELLVVDGVSTYYFTYFAF